MFVATWGEGLIATVAMDGSVFHCTESVRDDLQKRLRSDAIAWGEGDTIRRFKPGEPGHIRAVLESYDESVVTGDEVGWTA